MNRSALARIALVGLAIAFVARHDFWAWDDASRVFGLPVGLAYHVAFCFVVAALFALLVTAGGSAGRDRLPEADRS